MNKRTNQLNQGLTKLKEEQSKGYRICLENISKWTKFREDYEHLKGRLETLADTIEHDVMVPFGSVAFMPGKLIHTNEVMVLLGDNWFAERSAKQAAEIVTRRISQCDNTLAEFRKERRQYEQWMVSTEKVREEIGGDLLDIVEEFDEGDEKAWREKHRQNVKKYHQNKTAEESSLGREGETEEDYWRRLEMSEEGTDEICHTASEESDLSSSEEDSDEPGTDSSDGEAIEQTQKRKSVRWNETAPETLPESTLSVPTVKIKFTESKDPTASTSHEAMATTSVPVIQSPSDIYEQFYAKCDPKPLKSILKSSSIRKITSEPSIITTSSNTDTISSSTDKMTGVPRFLDQTKNTAFSGVIVERNPETIAKNSKESNPAPIKKISKFKEMQMKRLS